MGQIAGRGMTGTKEHYNYSPLLYSGLLDQGYKAIGEFDTRLGSVSGWKEPYRKGVAYYLKNEVVRGVLLWNTWDRVEKARKLIADDVSMTHIDLKSKLRD